MITSVARLANTCTGPWMTPEKIQCQKQVDTFDMLECLFSYLLVVSIQFCMILTYISVHFWSISALFWVDLS